MARYLVKQTSFINNALVQEGTEIEYDGTPSDNLEPVDAEAHKVSKRSGKANAESVARQKAAAIGAAPDQANTVAAVNAAAAAAAAAPVGDLV